MLPSLARSPVARRAKTDPTDEALIADYIRTQVPPRWVPATPELRQLQALVRRLDALLDMRTQERNRLGLAAAIVRPSIEATLTHLEAAITVIKKQIAAHIDQLSTPAENLTVPPIENLTDRRGDEPQVVIAS